MNPRVLLIGFSLAANVTLGAWLALRPPPAASATSAAASKPIPAPAPAIVDALNEPLTAATWERLAAAPVEDYVARLRAEGLPPTVVRTMIRARISAGYADRLNALRQSTSKDEYWLRGFISPDAHLTAEARAERRRLYREMEDATRAALGPEGEQFTGFEKTMRDRNFGPLTNSQVEQIAAIDRDYDDLRAQVRETMQGVTLPEDRAQLRLLDQEERNDLAATLSPADLFEYDLRNSPAAGQVRNATRYFNPTEQEYRDLVRLRLEFNRQYGICNLSQAEQTALRAAEKTTYQPQVEAVLGPERYAEYALTSSADFQSTANALARFNYELPVVREVMTLRESTTKRTTAIRENQAYTPEQRAAEQSALYLEASRQLNARLGAKAYAEFERSGSGNWLRNLKPKAATPGGSPP